MFNLESAIKHCEVMAKKREEIEEAYRNGLGIEIDKRSLEYKQLAEWLKELKAYRDDREDCDYKTLKIKLENAEDIIRGLREDLRDAREELRWR